MSAETTFFRKEVQKRKRKRRGWLLSEAYHLLTRSEIYVLFEHFWNSFDVFQEKFPEGRIKACSQHIPRVLGQRLWKVGYARFFLCPQYKALLLVGLGDYPIFISV